MFSLRTDDLDQQQVSPRIESSCVSKIELQHIITQTSRDKRGWQVTVCDIEFLQVFAIF